MGRRNRHPEPTRNSTWPAIIRWSGTATSASWLTSMPARPPRPSVSSTTPASPTRSAKSTTAPRRWTGWSRSRSAASPSRRRRPRPSGRPRTVKVPSTASTSSTPPATSTSPSKSNAACASSTARSRCSTALPGWSPSPKPYGARPTNTVSPGCASLINWTAPAPTSTTASSRSSTASERPRWCSISRSVPKADLQGVVDLVNNRAIVWENDGLGATFNYVDIPADLTDKAAEYREKLIETAVEQDDDVMEAYLRRGRARCGDAQASHPQGHHGTRLRARAVRFGVQEQGRPAPARRRCRLHAVAARRSGDQGRCCPTATKNRPVRLPTTSPSPRWPSRSMNDPFVGLAHLHPHLFGQAVQGFGP